MMIIIIIKIMNTPLWTIDIVFTVYSLHRVKAAIANLCKGDDEQLKAFSEWQIQASRARGLAVSWTASFASLHQLLN